MSTNVLSAERLRKKGRHIKRGTGVADGCSLWSYKREEYVILPGDLVITRAEDNSLGRGAALFPRPFKR